MISMYIYLIQNNIIKYTVEQYECLLNIENAINHMQDKQKTENTPDQH
jgi:hypothetical protein